MATVIPKSPTRARRAQTLEQLEQESPAQTLSQLACPRNLVQAIEAHPLLMARMMNKDIGTPEQIAAKMAEHVDSHPLGVAAGIYDLCMEAPEIADYATNVASFDLRFLQVTYAELLKDDKIRTMVNAQGLEDTVQSHMRVLSDVAQQFYAELAAKHGLETTIPAFTAQCERLCKSNLSDISDIVRAEIARYQLRVPGYAVDAEAQAACEQQVLAGLAIGDKQQALVAFQQYHHELCDKLPTSAQKALAHRARNVIAVIEHTLSQHLSDNVDPTELATRTSIGVDDKGQTLQQHDPTKLAVLNRLYLLDANTNFAIRDVYENTFEAQRDALLTHAGIVNLKQAQTILQAQLQLKNEPLHEQIFQHVLKQIENTLSNIKAEPHMWEHHLANHERSFRQYAQEIQHKHPTKSGLKQLFQILSDILFPHLKAQRQSMQKIFDHANKLSAFEESITVSQQTRLAVK